MWTVRKAEVALQHPIKKITGFQNPIYLNFNRFP